MYPSGRDHWGKAQAALEIVEAARRRGLEVGYDVPPGCVAVGRLSRYSRRGPGKEADCGHVRSYSGRAVAGPSCPRDRTRGRWPGSVATRNGTIGWFAVWENLNIVFGWAELSPRSLSERGQPPADAALLMFLEDEAQYWLAPQISATFRH